MMRFVHRRWMIVVAIGLCVSAWSFAEGSERAGNIIVLIADGCSADQYTFARWFKGEPLSFDAIRVGAVRTFVADSVIASSAPAASAFATGVRTGGRSIGVGPGAQTMSGVPVPDPEQQHRPLANLLEGARILGRATGIVATSRVTNATPAAFMAHVYSRDLEDDIMEQAVYQEIDVVFGGGIDRLLPPDGSGRRSDGENLIHELKGRGYQIVENREEMMKVKDGKVFGMFASGHMDPEIDRSNFHPDQPTLEEMTKKAIEILSGNPRGFFLVVEGSQIDWACHANDPASLLSELLCFDKAVKTALDFAQKDEKTLLLVLSDHNTGGFTIGNDHSNSQMTPEALLDPFRKMKSSALVLWKRLGVERSTARLREVLREDWGLDITDQDAEEILSLASRYREVGLEEFFALGRWISSRYTYVGWATHGHGGGDVPLHAFGPGRPLGVIEGPDVGRICAKAMALNLEELNRRLFLDAARVFGRANTRIDKSDPQNPVVRIDYEGRKAELPVNKNWLIMDGKARRVEGVVVYLEKREKVYLPLQAVNLIKGMTRPLPDVRIHDPQ